MKQKLNVIEDRFYFFFSKFLNNMNNKLKKNCLDLKYANKLVLNFEKNNFFIKICFKFKQK